MESFWHNNNTLKIFDNNLYIDGLKATDLVKKFGSPIYVYSKQRIKQNAESLINTFSKYYGDYQLLYAVKANNNPHILKILKESKVGFDASCINEIKLAKLVGTEPKKIFFTGVFPSAKDTKKAVNEKVILNLDNIADLDKLDELPEILSLRINPNITESGGEGLKFAGPDAKFGIWYDQAMPAYKKAKEMGIKRFAAHIMTGSNILDETYFRRTITELFNIIGPISKELKIDFDYTNIGGSLGIPYRPMDRFLDTNKLAREVSEEIKIQLEKYKMKKPVLMQEPGRFLLADAGILLSKIDSIKLSNKNWIGVDAGMNTLIRPAMYGSYHHLIQANKYGLKATDKYSIVGPICENTDLFLSDYELHNPEVEDVVAFLDAGAYGFGMSSNYNSRVRPAEILIEDKKAKLIRKSEEFKDLYYGTGF